MLVNAAAALAARAGIGADLPGALGEGLQRAAASVDSGAAAKVLDRWITTATALRPTG